MSKSRKTLTQRAYIVGSDILTTKRKPHRSEKGIGQVGRPKLFRPLSLRWSSRLTCLVLLRPSPIVCNQIALKPPVPVLSGCCFGTSTERFTGDSKQHFKATSDSHNRISSQCFSKSICQDGWQNSVELICGLVIEFTSRLNTGVHLGKTALHRHLGNRDSDRFELFEV